MPLDVVPGFDGRILGCQKDDARHHVIGVGEGDDLGPVGVDPQGGEDDVDPALIEQFDAVGRDDRHQFDVGRAAENTFGDGLRQIDFEALDVTVLIEPAERPLVGLDPDNQLAALLHLLEFVGIGLLTPEERER